MAFEIRMPQLGLTMEEGTVTAWRKKEGDEVKVGEVLLEITTDKLTNEVESEYDGILLKIVAEEGADIPVKGLLGYIGAQGEKIPLQTAEKASASTESSRMAEPAKPAAVVSTSRQERIRISPLAKKVAAKLGVDYTGLVGTGTGGRIVKADILAAAEKAVEVAQIPTKEERTTVAETTIPLMKGDTVYKPTGMRKVVAERMLQSHTEIPPVTQTTKVDVTELMKFRKLLQEEYGRKYSVNDFVLKATAKCLSVHPEILVSYDGLSIIQRAHVNLGMAVALEAGLIVPVIRDADKMSLDELTKKAKDLATRAKENRLVPEDYQDSTFTVSNLGMFGIESFTPIVNQPNAAILGVCAIQDELALDEEGNVCQKQVMRLSLTYDHRLMDGAVAARFVMDLRDILQTPMCILL